jgi:glycosyltransferase involved in cell wall biosynthesis
MRVSVVLPAYNAELYLAEAIDSVLSELDSRHELIVIDDGSTDATRDIMDRYGTRIVALSQPNTGTTRALNAGLARATGDIFGFQDGDDLWTPGRLDKQLAIFKRDSTVEAVLGLSQQFVSPDVPGHLREAFRPPEDILRGEGRTPMLIRREAFERIGAFDERFAIASVIDWFARARAAGLRSVMLEEVVLMRRLHQRNGGRVASEAQNAETLLALKKAIESRRRPR